MPLSRNLGALTLLDPSGPEWPVTGVLYLYMAVLVKPLRLLSLGRPRGMAVNLQIIYGQTTQYDDLLLLVEAHSRKGITP